MLGLPTAVPLPHQCSCMLWLPLVCLGDTCLMRDKPRFMPFHIPIGRPCLPAYDLTYVICRDLGLWHCSLEGGKEKVHVCCHAALDCPVIEL